jgi:hypothetical protein
MRTGKLLRKRELLMYVLKLIALLAALAWTSSMFKVGFGFYFEREKGKTEITGR